MSHFLTKEKEPAATWALRPSQSAQKFSCKRKFTTNERTKKASRNRKRKRNGRIVEEMWRSFRWGAPLTLFSNGRSGSVSGGSSWSEEEGSGYSEERSLPRRSSF
ncbi:hypothetical protein Lal_00002374 [Lupinus albus]|nr:hypothetical protein Lal_00002374 [Lupinus albus]